MDDTIRLSLETLKINNPVICVEAARRNVQELNYVKKFIDLEKSNNSTIIEVHNRPSYIQILSNEVIWRCKIWLILNLLKKELKQI